MSCSIDDQLIKASLKRLHATALASLTTNGFTSNSLFLLVVKPARAVLVLVS